jgi:ABC-type branched-subunit amino acid transport system ATPase component
MLETQDLTLHYGGSQILNGVSLQAPSRGRSPA